jgi:hypothetical protein
MLDSTSYFKASKLLAFTRDISYNRSCFFFQSNCIDKTFGFTSSGDIQCSKSMRVLYPRAWSLLHLKFVLTIS